MDQKIESIQHTDFAHTAITQKKLEKPGHHAHQVPSEFHKQRDDTHWVIIQTMVGIPNKILNSTRKGAIT